MSSFTANREGILWGSFVLIAAFGVANLHYGLNFERNPECRIERCSKECIPADIQRIKEVLRTNVHGQSSAVTAVLNALEQHEQNLADGRTHPLLLHFTGPDGSGKRYMAELIAANTYKYGLSSRFVFNNATDSYFNLDCSRSFFIYENQLSLPQQQDFGESIVVLLADAGHFPVELVHRIEFKAVSVQVMIDECFGGGDVDELTRKEVFKVNSEEFVKNGCEVITKEIRTVRSDL